MNIKEIRQEFEMTDMGEWTSLMKNMNPIQEAECRNFCFPARRRCKPVKKKMSGWK